MSVKGADVLRLASLEEALAVRIHQNSDHYRETRSPIAPHPRASERCDCRDRAAFTADALDRHALGTNKTGTRFRNGLDLEEEQALRSRLKNWLTAQAHMWGTVAGDKSRGEALQWAAQEIDTE
jgi:hypothetical protein